MATTFSTVVYVTSRKSDKYMPNINNMNTQLKLLSRQMNNWTYPNDTQV